MAKYKVTISQTWSETVVVTADHAREAKMKGWLKHKPKKVNYEIDAERE